jgi:penicillin amidase
MDDFSMVKKTFIGFFIALFIIFFSLGIFICIQIDKMTPEYSGKFYISGLKELIEISWDSTGVIHINGQNTSDVVLGSGYVAAKERLWQMEIMRRAAKGELSEIFGEITLDADRLFCTLNLDSLSKSLYGELSDESKIWLKKYCEGINRYIKQTAGNLPIEFILMRIEPTQWTPVDCLLQNRLMAWGLNLNWKTDLLYWRLSTLLSKDKFREIWPRWGKYPTVIANKALDNLILKNMLVHQQLKELLGVGEIIAGSNNWVISPQKSESGFALLANDPHLSLQMPPLWLEIHLKTPQLDVAGFSLPGSPGIIIGRNDCIAWGVTNGMIDDCDFFIEKVDTAAKVYWYDDKQYPLKVQKRVIKVKDSSDRLQTVYSTVNGPIFNLIFPELNIPQSISLKWVGWEKSDELYSFIKLSESKNWNDFENALRSYSLPAQNFVFADITGNIGYRLGGKVPVRTYESGLLPQIAYQKGNQWQGWIEYSKMPSMYNPEKGWIATANNQIMEDYYYYLSELWEPPFRIERISQLIEANDQLNVQIMQNIQIDRLNLLAKEVLPILLSDLQSSHMVDKNKEDALILLQNWNYEMNIEEIAPTIYEVLQNFLIKNIFQDELGSDLFNIFTDLPNFYLRIFHQVVNGSSSLWFDNVSTAAQENRGDIVADSFDDAWQYLKRILGEDLEDWRWGRLNKIHLEHVLGRVTLTRHIFNRGPYPFSGSGSTVNVGIYQYNVPYQVTGGASFRFLVDWQDKQHYYSILPGGNSGHFLSEYYDNQLDDWLLGRLKRVNLVDYKSKSSIVLLPLKE